MISKTKYFTTVLVLLCAFLSFNYSSCSNKTFTAFGAAGESPLKKSGEVEKAWEIQGAFRKIYDLYKDSVVYISTEQHIKMPPNPFFEFLGVPREQTRTGLGSGFIISEDGYICTNFHVVAPGGTVVDKITVVINGTSYKAEVQGYDQPNDIALLKINPEKKLVPVYIGNSDETQVGDWAIAIGNPFGLDKSFTVGVISAIARHDLGGKNDRRSYFQTDAAVNPGNSGGPLINIRGEVIGINRMIFSQSGGYMGIAFAIPINRVVPVIEQLKKKQKIQQGYIGIQPFPMSPQLASRLGWSGDGGVIVQAVLRNGPADQAGLQSGDVIYELNGEPIKSVEDLMTFIEQIPAGKTFNATVWRQGKTMHIKITTTARPN